MGNLLTDDENPEVVTGWYTTQFYQAQGIGRVNVINSTDVSHRKMKFLCNKCYHIHSVEVEENESVAYTIIAHGLDEKDDPEEIVRQPMNLWSFTAELFCKKCNAYINHFSVDSAMSDIIHALNINKYYTFNCCSGHMVGGSTPYIQFYPTSEFERFANTPKIPEDWKDPKELHFEKLERWYIDESFGTYTIFVKMPWDEDDHGMPIALQDLRNHLEDLRDQGVLSTLD